MNILKDFDCFFRNNRLDPDLKSTWDAFEADQKGLPWAEPKSVDASDSHQLSWEEIQALTGGLPSTSNTCCPYCQARKTFKIDRDLSQASWHCFYCNVSGTTTNPEAVPSKQRRQWKQFEAERKEQDRREKFTTAMRLWNEATAITPDPDVKVYLKARGGLELPPNPHEVMRWHPQCPFGENRRLPCIISLFRHAQTDEPTAIQRTYLYSALTGRSERMSLGRMAGSAIKLWPLADSQDLTVGEGIETVLAAIKLGVAAPPAWAVGVAGNLSCLPVVEGVKRLTILADNDQNGVGQKAADELGEEYERCGREVRILHPGRVKDFNDLLTGAKR